ncbi:hypothetical protein CRE_08762 [Caenorhabditis remanei]|uniref:Uncharacterized protein n=1 Tax=Caenorhabditis remanei TaxID=31234 RepID=E3LHD4_CAERE|nr:hypothetical protein CRE_08762 [Caenorhabditis remanei]
MSDIPEPCKVCAQPSQGRNFGVWSCRACAAFFRRAAPRKTREDTFVGNNENCTIFENGRYTCKNCRLKKCYDVGMDIGKFQNNRDPLSSCSLYQKRVKPMSLSNFLGRPEFILCLEPDRASCIKSVIDVSYLIEKAEIIFREGSTHSVIPRRFENCLEQMSAALEDIKRIKGKEKIQIVKYIGKTENFMFWEMTFTSAAKWLSQIPEFSELEMTVKLKILKTVWMLWARLQKLSETAEYQRNQELKDDVYMWTDNTCMDFKEVEVDLKWCTNYTTEQMNFYLAPELDESWKKCIESLIELQPTNVEINFMLIQLCLNDAGIRHQGKVLEATDRLLKIQADNLHYYYARTLQLPHYSNRLTKLLKVNKLIEKSVRLRREKNKIANLFDVFSVEFSHPEMFELT